MESWPMACAAHLRPNPHCNAGLVLGRVAFNTRPPALMDISDGLVRDLPRLLGLSGELGLANGEGSSLGAELTLTEEQIHPEVLRWSAAHNINPYHTMMVGGEDYALLGACAPDLMPSLEAAIPEITTIGTITQKGYITCNETPFSTQDGFDHFAKSAQNTASLNHHNL